MVLPHVLASDTTHRTHALCVEDAETVEEALGERPALAPVEQDGEDERGVDRALGGKRDVPRAEKALPKSAKSSARRLDLFWLSTSSPSLQSRLRQLPRYLKRSTTGMKQPPGSLMSDRSAPS